MSTINNFLLIFDHSSNRLVRCEDFGTDTALATSAYTDAEKQYRDSHVTDIVLVGSDSIETVQVTHSTYFPDGAKSLVQRALATQ